MVFLKKGGSFPVVDDHNPLESQGFGLDLEKKGHEKAEMEWGGNNNSGKEKTKS